MDECGLRERELLLEGAVELAEHLDPVEVVVLDLVELLFHLARVADVQDLGEGLDELVGHDLAKVGRVEAALELLDVVALLDHGDDRGVRAGAADPLLLEDLDQACFGVARRRARELLLRIRVHGRERLLLTHAGERLLIRTLRHARDLVEAVEDQHAARRAERARPRGVGSALDRDRGGVPLRWRHLARDCALPDQRVETQLVRVQRPRHLLRRQLHVRGTDRFVGFLRILVGAAEEVGLLGEVLVAEALADVRAHRVQGLAGDVRRVRTHVRDQTDGSLAGNVHTLIELLRGTHRPLRGKAQPIRARLLQRARDERRRRAAARALGFDRLDRVLRRRINLARDRADEARRALAAGVLADVHADVPHAHGLGDDGTALGDLLRRALEVGRGRQNPELKLLAPDLDKLGPERAVLTEPDVL